MKKYFSVKYNIALAVSALVLALGFFVARALTLPQVTIPDQPYSFDSSLSQSMSNSQTSMTLVSGTLKDGTALSGYQCFTIDIGLTTAEYTCGTASGTVISSLTRGIPPLTPTTTNVSLEFAHRVGADVRITDFPGLQILKRLANGQDPYPVPLSYDQSVATSTFTQYNLIDKAYADGIALQGAPLATTTVQGLVQAGTIAQLANTTQNGSTGAVLFAPGNLYASSSPGTQIIPVTQTNGKININFIDQTAIYTWTGTTTFTSNVTLSGPTTTLSGVFSVASTTASSTYGFGFTHIQTFTASTTWSKPLNVNKVWVRLVGGGATPAGTNYSGGGGGGGYCEKIADVSATSSIAVIVGLAGQTSSFGNFCSATGGSASSGSGGSGIAGGGGGVGSGGDINISGQAGGNTNSATGPVGSCGAGGGSVLGGGGAGSWNGGSASCSGSNGGIYGGGGGGCLGSSCTGGTGAQGVVIVEW